ncbi:hypothetical protein ACTXT7_008716 [Hymenolepis weldensis]
MGPVSGESKEGVHLVAGIYHLYVRMCTAMYVATEEFVVGLATSPPNTKTLVTAKADMVNTSSQSRQGLKSSSSSSTVVPDLYGKLGLISAKPSTSQMPPSPPKMSHAQNRQAMSRIEAALEIASKMDIQPAILRTDKGTQKPHPLVAALLGRGTKNQQQNKRDRRGQFGCGSKYHQRSHPYARL